VTRWREREGLRRFRIPTSDFDIGRCISAARSARPLPRGFTGHVVHPIHSIRRSALDVFCFCHCFFASHSLTLAFTLVGKGVKLSRNNRLIEWFNQ
jgi:hypothetical protein